MVLVVNGECPYLPICVRACSIYPKYLSDCVYVHMSFFLPFESGAIRSTDSVPYRLLHDGQSTCTEPREREGPLHLSALRCEKAQDFIRGLINNEGLTVSATNLAQPPALNKHFFSRECLVGVALAHDPAVH